ncbi:anti-sigma factor C-terminal domain-containing protein [Paenibacillus sp. N4]|uniref:anti sigma factor C-terminal domain-containing protein n=1 Tax=Paenibacillus vietnamensis TaxID=2590547 RepID=UPI001CD11F9C|nr:anti sigma factor C-terminal domain-containing protein [Paenibacillus vietnamensis]MCA0756239.1 anti-sigma factor C-terminal domain-containing protein [Paenibacillus vietnamensis]
MMDKERPFDERETKADEAEMEFTGLIRSARRKTLLRNAILSILAAAALLIFVTLGNTYALNKSSTGAMMDIQAMSRIQGANLNLTDYHEMPGLWSGSITYGTYKIIEGIPIPSSSRQFKYNALGHFSNPVGGKSEILNLSTPAAGSSAFPGGSRPFNDKTGQREMVFYHPGIEYNRYVNDLEQLSSMRPEHLVELGVSFDRDDYSADEITAMLPEGVHAAWYWVDTFEYERIDSMQTSEIDSPIAAVDAYGFSAYEDLNNQSPNNESDFIKLVEQGLTLNGKYEEEFNRIYTLLKGGKTVPDAANVKIIGAVLTGSPEALHQLEGMPYVRAAVLGAVTELY